MSAQLVPVNLATYGVLHLHDRLGVSIAKIERSNGSGFRDLCRRIGWQVVDGKGMRSTSDLEIRTAIALSAYGFAPPVVEQERPFGRFRADFAIPSAQVVIEVDGIHHLAQDVIEKDMRKDAFIRSRGWTVFRIDCTAGLGAKERIGVEVGRIVEQLLTSGLFPDLPIHYLSEEDIRFESIAASVRQVAERLS